MRLQLTDRSGPIVVEIEYRVNSKRAVVLCRHAAGPAQPAAQWPMAGQSRDIADPELWTERYHCPTWLDYLRQRNRPTDAERTLHARAIEFHMGPDPVRIRRMFERPVGSVRWKDETPDRSAAGETAIVGP